jgi:hypothetical protein
MHPLRQVVIVLPIAIPFQLFIVGFIGPALVHSLADSQPAARGVCFSLFLTETADPAYPWVVFAVPSEDVVNLIDETQGELFITLVARLLVKGEEIADGERVCP